MYAPAVEMLLEDEMGFSRGKAGSQYAGAKVDWRKPDGLRICSSHWRLNGYYFSLRAPLSNVVMVAVGILLLAVGLIALITEMLELWLSRARLLWSTGYRLVRPG